MLATESSTVQYTSNSKTCYAYNDYIYSTAGANWADATAFVQKLNDNNIEPTDSTIKGSGGTWRLLKNISDATAWNTASSGPSYFGVVEFLWTSLEFADDTTKANTFNLYNDSFIEFDKTYSATVSGGMMPIAEGTGFVVIWEKD